MNFHPVIMPIYNISRVCLLIPLGTPHKLRTSLNIKIFRAEMKPVYFTLLNESGMPARPNTSCVVCNVIAIGAVPHVCNFYYTLTFTQSYQKVPQTPLVSVAVLQDEKEVWNDVQVSCFI